MSIDEHVALLEACASIADDFERTERAAARQAHSENDGGSELFHSGGASAAKAIAAAIRASIPAPKPEPGT